MPKDMAACLEANQYLFAQRETETEWGSVRNSLWVMPAMLGFQHKPTHFFLLYPIGWVGSAEPSGPLVLSLFSEHVTLELLKAVKETQPQLPH